MYIPPLCHHMRDRIIATALAALLTLPTLACGGASMASRTLMEPQRQGPASSEPADARTGDWWRPAPPETELKKGEDEDEGDEVSANAGPGDGAGESTTVDTSTTEESPSDQPADGDGRASKETGKQVASDEPKQALVVEGNLTFEVKDVPESAREIRTYVESIDGRVQSEQLSGDERAWSGHMQLKLPPTRVDEFLAWLAERGDILDKYIHGTDVSRTLMDQQIQLDNLQLTLDRMRKLLDKEGIAMQDVLAIERELTRLRGEIEQIKGARRYLLDRVAMATLDVRLRRKDGAIPGRAKAKFHPGARVSTLFLLEPDGREAVRVGGGAVLHIIPRLTFEVDVFQAPEGESTALLATFGGSVYSDFLGRGQRRFFNPYLGLRIGYGNLDGSAFVFAAGGGVELFRHTYFVLDAGVNFVGFARQRFDATVASSLSAVFAF